MRFHILSLTALLATANGLPKSESSIPLPLVVWHGLGDSYDSDGIQYVGKIANKLYPGTFFHSIYLDKSGSSDRTASFFGDVNSQVADVCTQLSSIPELSNGFNAVGMSQGGQFLRAYIQRCNNPPVHTLITFGSQHNGIADFFGECKPADWVCWSTSNLLRNNKWSPFVQGKVVPAQYFRDPEDMENYLEHSAFLADLNNEREEKNGSYAENLATLKKFVMYVFEDDLTVIPKVSGWFYEFNKTTGEVTELKDRTLYKEDWIGLRRLDEEGRLAFESIPGEHMRLNDEILEESFRKYLGSEMAGSVVTEDRDFEL